jgi:VWFA-related protein
MDGPASLLSSKVFSMRFSPGFKFSFRGFSIVALIFLFLLPAWPKHDTDTKLTIHTELVLIPTLVTDKSGAHIRGLKQEDFTVEQNGKEQKIATFEEITSDTRRFSLPTNSAEFSNSFMSGPSAGRITLIVLDLINTRFSDQASARQELLKYLTESVDVREPTGLYVLTRSGIQVIHDFTTDPQILVAALHQVNGDPDQMVDSPDDSAAGGSSSGPSSGQPHAAGGGKGAKSSAVHGEASKLQSVLVGGELNFQSFEQRMAITYTLEAMQQVAQALVGFPGRKSLIWATGAFPFSVSDSMGIAPAGRDTLTDVLPLYERTWKLLNDAQIALYPVDVKGLRTSMPSASRSGAPHGGAGKPSNNRTFRQMDTQATFQTFASMTGGRAYFNSNDLVKGFHDAVDDSSTYYMLGYYLDRSDTKPGWQRLKVELKHEHGEVRARSGFFATNSTSDPESSRSNDISSALQSPLDFTSIPLSARWNNIEASQQQGKKHANYELRLPADSSLINATDNNHIVVDFVALARTPEGKQVDQPTGKKIDTHLTPQNLTAVQQNGVIYRGFLELSPGQYTVRFVVRDDLNGRTGSVEAPLRVE